MELLVTDTNYCLLLLHMVSLNITYSYDIQDTNNLKFHFSVRGKKFLGGEFSIGNTNF